METVWNIMIDRQILLQTGRKPEQLFEGGVKLAG